MLINAGGAWADDIIATAGSGEKFNLKKALGIHVILPRERLKITNTIAFKATADGRGLYMVLWGNVVLVCTTDTFSESCDELNIRREDIDYSLASINRLFPNAKITVDDIVSTYAGVRPLIGSNKGVSEDDMSRDFEIIRDERGMLSISGGKLTNCRLMAKKTVNMVYRFLEDSFKPCVSLSPISGGGTPVFKSKKLS